MARRSNDPIKSGARKAKTRRRVGVNATCTQCAEKRAEQLVRRSRPKLCLRCYARKHGTKETEGHHLGAEANSPVIVEVPITDHRTLTEAQYEWPPKTWRNPDGSPLLAIAGTLRGIADFISDLIVAFINHLAEAAEDIDAWLRDKYGLWWKDGPYDGWQPGNA
jgi:hypothetical protein